MLEKYWPNWREEQALRDGLKAIQASLKENYKFSVAIDLGKRQDRTAIATIQTEIDAKSREEFHSLIDIKVLPHKQNYVAQCDAIRDYLAHPRFDLWPTKTIIDASGVGEGPADMLKEAGLKFKRATITSGDSQRYKDGRYYISRNYLFSVLLKWLSRDNFAISADLEHALALRKELEALTLEQNKAGTQSYVSRDHDDLTVACALALFLLERSKAIRSGALPLSLASS